MLSKKVDFYRQLENEKLNEFFAEFFSLIKHKKLNETIIVYLLNYEILEEMLTVDYFA